MLAVSFLRREDKQEILSRKTELAQEGVCVTEDMGPGQLEGYSRLARLEVQIKEKHPNVQVTLVYLTSPGPGSNPARNSPASTEMEKDGRSGCAACSNLSHLC